MLAGAEAREGERVSDTAKEIERIAAMVVENLVAAQKAGTLTESKIAVAIGTFGSEVKRLAADEVRPPVKCADCDEQLQKKLQARCPTHIAMTMAKDAAKSKAKEHGPAILAKAMMGLQGAFEKYLGDEPEQPASPPSPPPPGADDFQVPPSS